mmetsp:Transcript_5377/g.11403  ORF Transcript_5377/g.11403 Transcript_5377/m.11403 type:complete len:280 (-) Transcript_5377:362-1201(-)
MVSPILFHINDILRQFVVFDGIQILPRGITLVRIILTSGGHKLMLELNGARMKGLLRVGTKGFTIAEQKNLVFFQGMVNGFQKVTGFRHQQETLFLSTHTIFTVGIGGRGMMTHTFITRMQGGGHDPFLGLCCGNVAFLLDQSQNSLSHGSFVGLQNVSIKVSQGDLSQQGPFLGLGHHGIQNMKETLHPFGKESIFVAFGQDSDQKVGIVLFELVECNTSVGINVRNRRGRNGGRYVLHGMLFHGSTVVVVQILRPIVGIRLVAHLKDNGINAHGFLG